MENEQRIYARIDRIINDKYMKVYFSSAKRELEEEYGSKNLDEPR